MSGTGHTQLRIRMALLRHRIGRYLPGLQPKEDSGNDKPRALWPWMALIVGLVLPWIASPHATPDTVEMLATGRCLLGLDAADAMCNSIDLGRYPLMFPLLSGLAWGAGLAPMLAASLIALAATALLCAATTATLSRRDQLAAVLVPGLILAVPALRTHLLSGDARGLSMLGLVGASIWIVRDGKRGMFLGAWLSLAILSRPETSIAVAGLLAITAAVRWRALIVAAPLAIGTWLGQTMLSQHLGGTRDWEMKVTGLVKVIPDDWIFQLVGLGMKETAFRSMVMDSAVPSQPSSTGAADWLMTALPLAVPGWLIAAAMLGLIFLIRSRHWRLLLVVVVWATPAVAVWVVPQTRDNVLPAANLGTLLLSMSALASLGLAGVLRWVATAIFPIHPPGTPYLAVAGLLIVGIGGAKSTYVPMEGIMELGEAYAQTHEWIEQTTAEDITIGVSFSTGGIPLLANRARTSMPSSWELGPWLDSPSRPDMFIISSIDSPGNHATVRELVAISTPLAVFRDGVTDVWVYGLGEP